MALDSIKSVFEGLEAIERWHKELLTPEERKLERRQRQWLALRDTVEGALCVSVIFTVWFAPWIALGWWLRKN